MNMSQDCIDVKTLLRSVDYRIARIREEITQAYSLVYREYLKRGYTEECPSQMRYTVYNALPQSSTFVTVADDIVLSTVSVIPDSPLGLPMDAIYRNEIDALRDQGKKVCEVTMLASNTDLFRGVSVMLNAKKMFFIFSLFKLVFDYLSIYHDYDFACITFHPKHKLIYDFLLFEDLGELKTYNHANGAPAIGKYINLHGFEERCKTMQREDLQKMFLRVKNEPEKFSGKFRFSEDDLRSFFVERHPILRNCSPEHLAYLKKCYPTYDFEKIMR
ncbi:MAG: hypothetical protein GF333_03185 [Candidatus Omnitrophica bacterium]|nr:hypothetical protein [Candidatus Omnitrophota bacterium]